MGDVKRIVLHEVIEELDSKTYKFFGHPDTLITLKIPGKMKEALERFSREMKVPMSRIMRAGATLLLLADEDMLEKLLQSVRR